MFYFTKCGEVINTDHVISMRVEVTATRTHAFGTVRALLNWGRNPQETILETVKSALRGATIPTAFTRKCDARLKELAALFNGENA